MTDQLKDDVCRNEEPPFSCIIPFLISTGSFEYKKEKDLKKKNARIRCTQAPESNQEKKKKANSVGMVNSISFSL